MGCSNAVSIPGFFCRKEVDKKEGGVSKCTSHLSNTLLIRVEFFVEIIFSFLNIL